MTFPNSGALDYIPDGAVFWAKVGQRDYPVTFQLQDATTTQKGVVEKATIDEAESGATDKFPDAAGVHTAFNSIEEQIGVNQSWQDVTSSRSTGVTYTNTTGKPIQIAVNIKDGGGPGGFTFTVAGMNISYSNPDRGTQTLSFVIPNGETYGSLSLNGNTLSKWLELR